MFTSYILQILMYIVLIGLLHYFYLFFRNNLTTPKVIDLVKRPTTEYKKMYDTIKQTKQSDEMKNELKDYFKNLNKIPSDANNTPNHSKPSNTTTHPHNKGNNTTSLSPNIPSNNISLEYSNLSHGGGGSIPYSSF